jgi:hypothetical protein
VVLLALAGLSVASADDDSAAERMIRVDTPVWRRIVSLPKLAIEAFHWPVGKLLGWAEDVRIDRRLHDAIVWKDNDDLPVPEPKADETGGHAWWDAYRSTYVEPFARLFDLGDTVPRLARAARLAGPREAVNVNALDEVPDSTWFTDRTLRSRLSADELVRGPNYAPPLASDGPLAVLSASIAGTQPNLWVRDESGTEYLLQFDPRGFPALATGADVVSSRIFHALGWNVARYDVATIDPGRLEPAPDGRFTDRYGRERALRAEDLRVALASVERRTDGRLRATASPRLPGTEKGGFRMSGVRADDANDTIPHEDRRDLRGLRVVAAWLDHVDFRSGNTLDTFVADGPASDRGHLVHHLVDFNATLGAWSDGWKPPWMGHEPAMHPAASLAVALHLWTPPWAGAEASNPALGHFDAEHFDPGGWTPIFPIAPFERATARDEFWGARLVFALDDGEIATMVAAAEWPDAATADVLTRVLRDRRRRIAERYFDTRRLNPVDRIAVEQGDLVFRDLGVASGVVDAARARYAFRAENGDVAESAVPRFALPSFATRRTAEIESSHDAGVTWSPPVRVTLEPATNGWRVAAIDRLVR